MPLHRGIEVYIEVDGKPLEEYNGAVDAGKERVYNCFVESEVGKVFQMHVKFEPNTKYTLGIDPFVDGLQVDSFISDSGEIRITGFQSDTSIRQFVFTEVNFTDDDDAAFGSDSLGVIEVQIIRCEKNYRGRRSSGALEGMGIPDENPMQEKSKKLGGHRVGAGTPIPTTSDKAYYSVELYDKSDEQPYAIFRFMYRPISILRAQNIAPPLSAPTMSGNNALVESSSESRRRKSKAPSTNTTPNITDRNWHGRSNPLSDSNPQSPAKREIIEVDDEDDRELTRLQSEIQAKQHQVDELKRRKRVKHEPSVEVMPNYKLDENGAIDLTAC